MKGKMMENGGLVGGFNPSEKDYIVNLDHFPNFRGENHKNI